MDQLAVEQIPGHARRGITPE